MLKVGVDIEDISRFENKDPKFFFRVFTKNELDYCFKNKNPNPHLCARYCAKEAVIKALERKDIPYSKIEILNKDNGAPYINILVDEFKNYNFSLSISHEKEKAVAFVVVTVNWLYR